MQPLALMRAPIELVEQKGRHSDLFAPDIPHEITQKIGAKCIETLVSR